MSDLYAFLAQHGIDYVRHDHAPVYTCEEELEHVPESGAARTKNLFLRDRRGKRHLLLVDADVWAAPSLHAHPLRNDATVVLSHDGLVRFLAATSHQPRIVTVRSESAASA